MRSTDTIRVYVVGGFLGAGKTTALSRLARTYTGEGRRVGMIANDQAEDLVDAVTLRGLGFRVEEVAGACFCCKFDDLAGAAERIRVEQRPDVLLAEPVGSCTDIAATVVAPLRKLYGERYSVMPYSVLVDPVRVRQIVLDRGFGGFSAKVAYIFQKQLEEANVICINKSDLLDRAERALLRDAVAEEFRGKTVVVVSALTGEGFDEWLAVLDGLPGASAPIVPVDYDAYAEGEAELGWLNMTVGLSGEGAGGFDANRVLTDIVERLYATLAEQGAECAHLKASVEAGGRTALASAVGHGAAPRLAQGLPGPVDACKLVLNARVHEDPERIKALAVSAVEDVVRRHGVAAHLGREAHFRPGRPVATHRFTTVDG